MLVSGAGIAMGAGGEATSVEGRQGRTDTRGGRVTSSGLLEHGLGSFEWQPEGTQMELPNFSLTSFPRFFVRRIAKFITEKSRGGG